MYEYHLYIYYTSLYIYTVYISYIYLYITYIYTYIYISYIYIWICQSLPKHLPFLCTKPQSCGDGSIGIKGEGSLFLQGGDQGRRKRKKTAPTTVEPQEKTSKNQFQNSGSVCIYIYIPKTHMSFVFFGWDVCVCFFWGGGLGSKNKYAVDDCRVITIRYKWRISVENTEFEPIFGHVDLLV